MPDDLSTKTVLVWDNCLFVHVALKLGEAFKKVYYGSPYVNAFPRSNATLPGDGLELIDRIRDFWTLAREVDLIVFPDVGFGDMQETCEDLGFRVWGSRWGENLELDRWALKDLLAKLKMPVAESHRIVGIENLRQFIQDRADGEEETWWVKTSRYRGDFETFQVVTYDHVKPKLDELEASLGMKGVIYPFIVEHNIPAICEIGYDGYTIDGKFPSKAAFGIEIKDIGFIGAFKDYADLPAQIRWANEKLSPVLERYRYRGFFSTELRINEANEVYLTDPCCRCASPPSEAYIEWFKNWPEIIWHGAGGELVDPIPEAKFAVEAMIHSSWADKSWQPVIYPKEIERWVKLRNCCCIDGVMCSVPQSVGLPEIGAVVGLDNTVLGAIKKMVEHAKQVDGYYLEVKTQAIPKAIQKVKEAQECGVSLTDNLPTANELEKVMSDE